VSFREESLSCGFAQRRLFHPQAFLLLQVCPAVLPVRRHRSTPLALLRRRCALLHRHLHHSLRVRRRLVVRLFQHLRRRASAALHVLLLLFDRSLRSAPPDGVGLHHPSQRRERWAHTLLLLVFPRQGIGHNVLLPLDILNLDVVLRQLFHPPNLPRRQRPLREEMLQRIVIRTRRHRSA